jgi:hypothetical protein
MAPAAAGAVPGGALAAASPGPEDAAKSPSRTLPMIGGSFSIGLSNCEGKSMSNSRMKKLALGLSAALAMMWSPAHAQRVIIATDFIFAAATNDIVGAFQNYYFTNYNLNYDVPMVATGSANFE